MGPMQRQPGRGPMGRGEGLLELLAVRGRGHEPFTGSGKVANHWHQTNSGLNPGSATNYLRDLGQVIEPSGL